jgi:hypothetical protein
VSEAFVIGYDPGGNGNHGLAALRVEERGTDWVPLELSVTTARVLADVVEWVTDTCRDVRMVALGVDTLTEWNSGPGGWRPADRWLRATYPDVASSVISPASLYGSMVINGGGLLIQLHDRLQSDGTVVTEAHPKVCYRAITGGKADWKESPANRDTMAAWLIGELGVGRAEEIGVKDDHRFDAATSALAALPVDARSACAPGCRLRRSHPLLRAHALLVAARCTRTGLNGGGAAFTSRLRPCIRTEPPPRARLTHVRCHPHHRLGHRRAPDPRSPSPIVT